MEIEFLDWYSLLLCLQPHLLLGLICQIIKVYLLFPFGGCNLELCLDGTESNVLHIFSISHEYFSHVSLKKFQIQLLADVNLKHTPELAELVDDTKVCLKFLTSFWFPLQGIFDTFIFLWKMIAV